MSPSEHLRRATRHAACHQRLVLGAKYDEPESYEAVQCLVETRGNSTELENRIGTTNAWAGQQTMDVDGYRWSWTYSSQNGFAGTFTAIGDE